MYKPLSGYYYVRKGDSLSRIAVSQYGSAGVWLAIAEANHLRAPYRIVVGLRLRLPGLDEIAHRHGHPNDGQIRHRPPPGSPGENHLGTIGDRHAASLDHPVASLDHSAAPLDHTRDAHADHAVQSRELFASPVARNVRFPALKFKLDEFFHPIKVLNADRGHFDPIDRRDHIAGGRDFYHARIVPRDDQSQHKGGQWRGRIQRNGCGGGEDPLVGRVEDRRLWVRDPTEWNLGTREASVKCKFTIASRLGGHVIATSKYEAPVSQRLQIHLRTCSAEG